MSCVVCLASCARSFIIDVAGPTLSCSDGWVYDVGPTFNPGFLFEISGSFASCDVVCKAVLSWCLVWGSRE